MSTGGPMATAALGLELQGRGKNQESRNAHQAPHTLIICLIQAVGFRIRRKAVAN